MCASQVIPLLGRQTGVGVQRHRVFVSYSHRDRRHLDRLRVHLQPLERKGLSDVWDDTRLSRGKIISGVGTTLDVVPTLFQALGMLDEQNRLIPRPGAIPERVFLPFPGRVVDIFEQRPPEPNVAGGGPAGSNP